MSRLKKAGYRGASLQELLASPRNEEASCKRIALTFDDCFEGAYRNAAPILDEFGFRATFFVVVDYVGKTMWGDPVTQKWAREAKRGRTPFPMMNWHQIGELQRAGMEIGSHSISHPNLTELPEKRAAREIAESKTVLEEKLGAPIHAFCYPWGRHNDALARLVCDAGYQYACTTRCDRVTFETNRFLLPRIAGPGSVTDLIFEINGVPKNFLTRSMLRAARSFERLGLSITFPEARPGGAS
jgi:peptidoglycan/xylan/chitin deacetylase (PgdA/CDA1 family)